MAKRDREKTARNKLINSYSSKLKVLLPGVLEETGITSAMSLHGFIGHKNEYFIDVKNDVIHSPEQFTSMWIEGMLEYVKDIPNPDRNSSNVYYEIYLLSKDFKCFREYLYLFLERTYLRNFDAYNKTKPLVKDAEIWIGQNNANYGLLVCPRFVDGRWENDKSEIRHFPKKYWSIGHILETGLVIPDSKDRMLFKSVEEYLLFFENVLVRNSGSIHEREIARKYSQYVLDRDNSEDIPLLIPEFRYNGIAKKHEYRLDFTIIESLNLNKFGFELSPWSTHGYLKGTKDKNQKTINLEAKSNFEKEISKQRKYFHKFGIYTLFYSDDSLTNIDLVFKDMVKYLEPNGTKTQLKLHVFQRLLDSNL